MKIKNMQQYVWFGTCVRFLQDSRQGWKINEKENDGKILNNLELFFQYLVDLDLDVTYRASYGLSKILERFKKMPANSVLSPEDANELSEEMTKVRTTLDAELSGLSAYTIEQGRYNSDYLINDIGKLFAKDVFFNAPDFAKVDLVEAGKCIAFERYTAAAFHLLRGTESVLRVFYCAQVKQKRCQLMWGNMVNDMKKRPKTKVNDTLLNHLDNIRISFRNPTAHPEKTYDMNEVQDLFSLCIDVINRMITLIIKK